MYPIIRRYASFYQAGGVSPSTAAQCAEKLNRVFRKLCENHGVTMYDDRIEGLTASALTDFYIALADSGLKMSTRNCYVAFLNPFLRWAYQNELLPKDLSAILSHHKLPSPNAIPEYQRVNKRLDVDQVNQLLSTTVGYNCVRDRAIIALFVYSGLRVSELCSLTIGSVMEHPDGTIYLRRKGGSWCHAHIGSAVYPYLQDYLNTREDRNDMNAPLFITTHGNPCSRKQLYDVLSRKQKALGLATGPHVFRHTFISQIGETAGASAARDLANHTSLVVTNRYSHSTQEERTSAVNRLPWGRK